MPPRLSYPVVTARHDTITATAYRALFPGFDHGQSNDKQDAGDSLLVISLRF